MLARPIHASVFAFSRRVIASALALGLTTAPACHRAPTLTGADQVQDLNIEVTALKDNGLAAQTWPVVDHAMLQLIGSASAPGCAVGIARNNELIYLQGYGKAKLGGEDWGVSTMGVVGSISKTLTAAAVMRLDQLHWLDTTAQVGDFLPTGNPALAAARIDALLDHSSGAGGASYLEAATPAWEPGSLAAQCAQGASIDCGAVAKALASPRHAFSQYEATEVVSPLAGGSPHQGVYSNVGYSVLGAVIDELAQGTSYTGYEDLVWHQVGNLKRPAYHAENLLSLAHSHSWRRLDIPHRAVGYAPSDGGYVVKEAFDPPILGGVEGWQGPAGGWAMTIGDLTRFAVALNTAQIVDAARLAEMRAIRTDLDDFLDHYGLGVMHGTGANAPYWHGGQIAGHSAAWTWWPDQGGQSLGIALLCNRQDLDMFTLRATATTIAGLIAGSSPSPVAPPSLTQVGAGVLNQRTWALGTSRAWQAAPRDVIAPLTGLSYDLVLSVHLEQDFLVFVLGEATVNGGTAVPSGRPPAVLHKTEFATDPWLGTKPVDVQLATPFGDVIVHDFTLRGGFAAWGARMERVSLRGTLDARELAPLAGIPASAMCAQVAGTDAACRPCADGAVACTRIHYEHLDGREVSMP
jgi:CubicO group peptidase (beta-lactamase class C family)